MNCKSLIEKMSSLDKDFRFMALSDLKGSLESAKNSLFSYDSSVTALVEKVLLLLKDNSGEVQNMAINCLYPLMNNMGTAVVFVVCNTLNNYSQDSDEHVRDTASVAMKTLVTEIPPSSPILKSFCDAIVPKLLAAMKAADIEESRLVNSLDLLYEITSRNPLLILSYASDISNITMKLLDNSRSLIRKKAINMYSLLLLESGSHDFTVFVTLLIEKTDKCGSISSDLLKSFLYALTSICRLDPLRFTSFIGTAVGSLLRLIQNEEGKDRDNIDDELLESAFLALESFHSKCHTESEAHVQEILSVALKFVKYDPNYQDLDDDVDNQMDISDDDDDDDDNDEEGFDDEDEYSDDDDISWRVRKVSLKLISSICALASPDCFSTNVDSIMDSLVKRLRERNESVKLEVFSALMETLKRVSSLKEMNDGSLMKRLEKILPSLVGHGLKTSLSDKSIKVKATCFSTLSLLVTVLPNSAVTGELFSPIIDISVGSLLLNLTSHLPLEIMGLYRVLLSKMSWNVFKTKSDLWSKLLTLILKKVYHASAEALMLYTEMIKLASQQEKVGEDVAFMKPVFQLVDQALKTVSSIESDSESKERYLEFLGVTFSVIHNPELESLWNTKVSVSLSQLLKVNEVLRIKVVFVFHQILSSTEIPIGRETIVTLIDEFASYLNKVDRHLKISAVKVLQLCISKKSLNIEAAFVKKVVIPQLLQSLTVDPKTIDMQFAPLAFETLKMVLESYQDDCIMDFEKSVVPDLRLAFIQKDSFLTSETSISLFLLFKRYGAMSGLRCKDLIESIIADVESNYTFSNRQSISTAAGAIAALVFDSRELADCIVPRIFSIASEKRSSDVIKILSIMCIGEIGRVIKFSNYNLDVGKLLLEYFLYPIEEIKMQASLALGNVCTGNMNLYFPSLLQIIQTNPDQKHLLLYSLKQILYLFSVGDAKDRDQVSPYLNDILAVLHEFHNNTDDSIRNSVSDCVGRLYLISEQAMTPVLNQYLSSSEAISRAVGVAAIRIILHVKSNVHDEAIKRLMKGFTLELIKDPELIVRKQALTTLKSALHWKAELLKDILSSTVQSNLYEETRVRNELIRQVTVGPFKHNIDDGLENRRMAYECMYSLLEKQCYRDLNYVKFIKTVLEALKDVSEVKLLANQLIIKLAIITPHTLFAYLNDITDSFRAVLETKLKDNAVKQEVESHEELVRSILRAIYVLLRQFNSTNFGNSILGGPSSVTSSSNAPKFEKLLFDFITSEKAQFRTEYEKQKPQIEQSLSFYNSSSATTTRLV